MNKRLPAESNFSWWIVHNQPRLNPTNFSWWIVHNQPTDERLAFFPNPTHGSGWKFQAQPMETAL